MTDIAARPGKIEATAMMIALLAALMALFAAGLQYMRCTCNAARHCMRCNAAPR